MENLELLKEMVKQKGLKFTKQRELIYSILLNSTEHLSAEEIFNLIKKEYPTNSIGLATIYRNLSFLEENNLIKAIKIKDGVKKYEINKNEHHDHLICIKCGKIIEFFNEKIEKEQEKIAKEFGFSLTGHCMYLYGICKECKEK